MVVLFLALLASAPSSAGSAEADRFKAYFARGEQLYKDGEFGAAIWNFRQADALRVTPEVAFDLAKCHEKLGDQALTLYYYRQYLRRAPKATDASDVAALVGAAMGQAMGEGRGLLEVEASAAGSAQVGDKQFPEFPVAMLLPPGNYELLARFNGTPRRRLVQVVTGKPTWLPFEPLPPPLLGEAVALVEWKPQVGEKAPPRSTSGLRVASYVVLGASVAALAAGTAMGAMSSADASRLRTQRSGLTLKQATELANSANAKGTAANYLWIGGGVGAVAGGVMFVVSIPEPGMKAGSGR